MVSTNPTMYHELAQPLVHLSNEVPQLSEIENVTVCGISATEDELFDRVKEFCHAILMKEQNSIRRTRDSQLPLWICYFTLIGLLAKIEDKETVSDDGLYTDSKYYHMLIQRSRSDFIFFSQFAIIVSVVIAGMVMLCDKCKAPKRNMNYIPNL